MRDYETGIGRTPVAGAGRKKRRSALTDVAPWDLPFEGPDPIVQFWAEKRAAEGEHADGTTPVEPATAADGGTAGDDDPAAIDAALRAGWDAGQEELAGQVAAEEFHIPPGALRLFDTDVLAEKVTNAEARMENLDSSALAGQLGHWRRMAEDQQRGWRPLLQVNAAQIETLDGLAAVAPHFTRLIDLYRQALQAALNTGQAVRCPPLLLVGPPGVGKTYVAARLAALLGTTFVEITMTTATGVNVLGGTDRVWKNPRLGKVAEALLSGPTASPIILLDEIDKAFTNRDTDRPLDSLHSLLEPSTAGRFRDEFLEAEINASGILWLATANDIDAMAASILDRFIILDILAPDEAAMLAVTASIIDEAMKSFGDWFIETHDTMVMQRLAATHPRRGRRLITLALTHAAAQSSRLLRASDIDAAERMIGKREVRRIGFITGR